MNRSFIDRADQNSATILESAQDTAIQPLVSPCADEIVGPVLAAPGIYSVNLASVGNPDFGEDPRRGLLGVCTRSADVGSLAEAATVCRAYISEHGLGGGNWAGGGICDARGKLVARVSYNGRVWKPGN